mgnify:CR=1 FL=1|tara:strand:- start:3248 stop:3481 length:234 start_codon:yes stop_codon:yes gene_type:complete
MVMEVKLDMVDEDLRAKDVLLLLEKHESECNLRYQAINEKLESQAVTLEKLDQRMWFIGVLVIAAPFGMLLVERLIQ